MGYSYIQSANYVYRYRLSCYFEDGKNGIFDLTRYLNLDGVFAKLRDERYAKAFAICNGVLTWGDGELDIAPETVYHNATGEPYSDWKEE